MKIHAEPLLKPACFQAPTKFDEHTKLHHSTVVRNISGPIGLTRKSYDFVVGEDVMLRAIKKGGRYQIYDISGTDPLLRGALVQGVCKDIGYQLQKEDGSVAATIYYKISLAKNAPRQAEVHLNGAESPVGSPIFRSRGPNTDAGKYGLNFRGRGRVASCKNLQLTDNDGKMVLQMAKWSPHQFHVDYKADFCPFQAFGFALAQFDL